jgi:hypothetical protein
MNVRIILIGREHKHGMYFPTIRYESESASQSVLERQEHVHVDIIIVDPHRKGLDLEVSRALLWKTVEDEVAICNNDSRCSGIIIITVVHHKSYLENEMEQKGIYCFLIVMLWKL